VAEAGRVVGIVLVGFERLGRGIELAQAPAKSTYPQVIAPVLINSVYIVRTDACRFLGIVLVSRELSGASVKAIKASVESTNPQSTIPVFVQSLNVFTRKTIFFGVGPDGVSVVKIESVFGAKPHISLTILENAEYAGMAKALFEREMLEPDVTYLSLSNGNASYP
jgi:hypothetical protein